MKGSEITAVFVLIAGLASVTCGPEPKTTIEADPDFHLTLLSGDVWGIYIEELGYTLAASTMVHPGDTEATCGVTYEYASGDTRYNEYDFQVEAFVYDWEGFYLFLSSEDLSFEVEATYLPQDPNDPLGDHL